MNKTLSGLAAAAWLALGASAALGQVKDVPAVTAPVGAPLVSPTMTGPSIQLAGPTIQPASTILALGNVLPAAPTTVGIAPAAGPRRAALAGARAGATASSDESTPAQAGPVEVHAQRFERFMKDIMGKRVPNEKEMRALLESYLEERQVPTDSELAEALEGRFFAPPEAVSPRFRAFAPGLRKLAAAHNVSVASLEALIVDTGLDQILAGPHEADMLVAALDQQLTSSEVRASVAHYPATEQGEALRNLAENVTTKSGKSVEELARAGAFLYVDFHGRRVRKISSGRDPDVSSADVVFYATLHAGRWKIGVYRQNYRPGVRGPDASFEGALRDWLIAGGIRPEDLAF